MSPVRFGTSGWRGIIAKEFTWEKVDIVADAIAVLLQEQKRTSVVVGGDCRFLSPELAGSTAERLAGYGFDVRIPAGPCPTPVLSHACIRGGLGGVINFTASHNPPVYNGIKFSPWHGGPAGGDITSAIEEIIREGNSPSVGSGSVTCFDPVPEYVEAVLAYIDRSSFSGAGLRVVYDAFSGTGSGILDRMLVELGASVRVMNAGPDPLFAGRQHPDPGEEGTADLAGEVVKSGACLGVATDGDADRFGIVDESGGYVSPHDFLPLLLHHLAGRRALGGRVVRSVTTCSLLDRVASAYGLETVVTPVGFKHLGAEMLKGDVLLAGEESGGLSVSGHVPEKDGILACLLACEMAAIEDGGLVGGLESLWEAHGRVFVSRLDIPLDDGLERRIRSDLFETVPSRMAGRPVRATDRTDGVSMLLDGGGRVLVRLSGTEPLARVYLQSDSQEELDELVAGVRCDLLDGRAIP